MGKHYHRWPDGTSGWYKPDSAACAAAVQNARSKKALCRRVARTIHHPAYQSYNDAYYNLTDDERRELDGFGDNPPLIGVGYPNAIT
tara:strand:- start:41 stop:301 length:261 start_codon:yes stop_codon:yes gene_type:complete